MVSELKVRALRQRLRAAESADCKDDSQPIREAAPKDDSQTIRDEAQPIPPPRIARRRVPNSGCSPSPYFCIYRSIVGGVTPASENFGN